MTWMEHLTWTCHVCNQERPDARISVFTRTGLSGWSVNVRHCNDNPDCIQRAPEVAAEMAAPLIKLDEER